MAATGTGPLGGVLGGDRGQRDAELAKDLASKLDGVNPSQVQKALGEVRSERRTERRKQLAAGLAAELDGVSQDDVEKALAKLETTRAQSRGDGERRDGRRGGFGRRGDFAAALAKELGKSEADVRKAFRAAGKKELSSRLDQAVKDGRLTRKRADQIEKRFENGPPAFRRGMRGHHHGGPGFGGPGFDGPPPGCPPPCA